jgi:PAS domain S-box-containing protein
MKFSPLKPLKSLMNRMGARSRIAFGQVLLLVGVLMLAITLHIVPNEQQAATQGRAKFCEAVAVHCSTCVARGQDELLTESFTPMVARDSDVLSATIVKSDGTKVADYRAPGGGSAREETHILVPIWENDIRWGTVEIHFRPLTRSGIWAYLLNPQLDMLVFVISACAALFTVYLRKMLQHLDPSKVVPPRVRSALDTLAEGLLVLDNKQRIMLANQAFATLAGRSAEELMGTSVTKLPWVVTNADAPAEYPWEQVKRDGQPRRGDCLRLHDSSGALRTFNVNCSPILGDDSKEGEKARGVLVSLDDVTVLEQKEHELRISRDTAESANQAKSEFLARMSHEIRTPMNAILGFADVLRRGYESNEAERQEYLETIHSSGQHLLELINDVLDLSKIEAGKLEIELSRCSPHKLISEVVSVLSVRARQKGIALEFKWDSQAPESIETDPTRLRQVITNLIGNAIKFTDTGAVRVYAQILADGPAPAMEIRIVDTGIGMKPEAIGRIFTPFSQADSSITRRFGGTGLGLSISKQIVEALGGGIRVESEYGHGSTFIVKVGAGLLDGVKLLGPAEVERSAAAASASAVAPVLRLPPCRLLLVEDGVSNRKLITLVLQRAGAGTIDEAEDGKSGSDRALAGNYDVVLMDMQMPVMDGYTAATLLRSKGFTKPIIALTAHAMRGDEEKCRAAGCSGFLTKPIDMDLLVRTVAGAMGDRAVEAVPSASAAKPSVAVPPPSIAPAQPIKSSLPTEDPEFAEIVDEFVNRLHQQLGAIHQAWDRQALDDLARVAHWVKGSGGTAGFDALTAPAKALEMAAKEQKLDSIGAAIAELQSIVNRIVPANAPNPAQAELMAKTGR